MRLLSCASLALLCFLGLAGCDDNHAGGVTDIGNSIAGIVVTENGTPVENARVVAYFDSWDNVSQMDSLETYTDASGHFRMDGLKDSLRVFFASSGKNCGMQQEGKKIVVGKYKQLRGRIATEKAGRVRVVGSTLETELQENGSFSFDSLPPGDISIAYTSLMGIPQSHFTFHTIDDRKEIRLPDLVEDTLRASWLVIADKAYYSDAGLGGFVADNDLVTPRIVTKVTVALDFAVTKTLYGFVLPVKFNSLIDFHKFSDPAFFDVLSSDGSSLDFEVDYWNSTLSQGLLWVRVDSIPAGARFLDFYLALRTDAMKHVSPYRETDSVAVALHFNDDDATASRDSGVISYGVKFSQGQYIDLDSLCLFATDFTISLWVNWSGINGYYQILFAQRSYWPNTSHFQWYYDGIKNVFAVYNSADQLVLFSEAIIPKKEWAYLTLVFKDGKLAMYVDGVQMGKSGAFTFLDSDIRVPFRVGGGEFTGEAWNGSLDELRVELVARPDEWIRLAYETQKSVAF